MTRTGEDRLTALWMPAMRALRPAEMVRQQQAVRRAITDDGYIDPAAVLPATGPLVGFDTASHTASSSDTVTPAEYLSVTVTLPDGVWTFKAMGAVTGSLSTATNLNSYVYLNGEASTNFQIPIAAADRLATVFPRYSLDAVSGDVFLQIMFRPSSGTATAEAGYYLYRAERIG